MDYFTGDWHLGHNNIITHCNRPFANVDEMDSAIINNINAAALPDDRVFNVGDVAFKGAASKVGSWRARINCKNVFITPGNHDNKNLSILGKYFTMLPKEYEYKNGTYMLVLNHYCMRVWPNSHHGAGHLYGHSHGKLSPSITANGYGAMAFDVGVDCWDFKPLSLDQVREIMQHRSTTKMTGRNEIDDHHKPRSVYAGV